MKAILLAFMAGVLLLAAGSWVLRRTGANRARALTVVFLVILPVLGATHLLTSPDLGFLPPELQTPLLGVDFCFALFLYAAGFFGGVLQFYNLADRGFSLRILIDILHTPSGAMSAAEIMQGYSDGRGIRWMYDKRVEGMTYAGLVVGTGNGLALTERGRRTARLSSWLQRLARDDNGEERR